MNVSIEYSDLIEEWNRSKTIVLGAKQYIRIRVKTAAETMRTFIKLRMPVDTGAAQSVWGSETLSSVAIANGWAMGVWEFTDDGMTHTQGAEHNSFAYIIRLNEGSSSQAPAGFIDAEVEKANIELEEGILKDIGGLLD